MAVSTSSSGCTSASASVVSDPTGPDSNLDTDEEEEHNERDGDVTAGQVKVSHGSGHIETKED